MDCAWVPRPSGLTPAILAMTLSFHKIAPLEIVEREFREGTMFRQSCTILTAALLRAAFPALGQQLPDGPGKELAQANCNICHALLSRVGAGYTAEGWNTVLRMMVNQGAPLPADQIEPLKAYLIKSFPEKGKPAGAVIPGVRENLVQGMAGADAGLAAA